MSFEDPALVDVGEHLTVVVGVAFSTSKLNVADEAGFLLSPRYATVSETGPWAEAGVYLTLHEDFVDIVDDSLQVGGVSLPGPLIDQVTLPVGALAPKMFTVHVVDFPTVGTAEQVADIGVTTKSVVALLANVSASPP
jgi:hypothetical protein